MKQKYRRVYFFVIAGVFLVLAPILLLYGMGFTVDVAHSALRRSGSLSLRSFPSDASISINGQGLGRSTPALINRLSEGSYEVSVIKLGFTPWARRVTIGPNQTTIFDTIPLLYQDPNPSTLFQLPTTTSVVPDRENKHFLFVADAGSGTSLAFSSRPETERTRTSDRLPPATMRWSLDNQNVALSRPAEYGTTITILNINPNIPIVELGGEDVEGSSLKDASLIAYQWSPTDAHELYLQFDHTLTRYHLLQKTWKTFDLQIGSSWLVIDQRFITTSEEGVKEWKLDESTMPQPEILISTPFQLIEPHSSRTVLLLRKNPEAPIQLFTPEQGEWKEIPLSIAAGQAHWSSTRSALMLSNDFEFLLFEVAENKQRLVTRSGKPMVDLTSLSEDRGFLFRQENEIKAVLFDKGLDSDFIVTVLEQPSTTLLGTGPDTELYFLQSDARSRRLMRSLLKKPASGIPF